MKKDLLYISIYYSGNKWEYLLNELNKILRSPSVPKNKFVIFFTRKYGDCVKILFCLNLELRSVLEDQLSTTITSFFSENPSRRRRMNYAPGQYLWKLRKNNSINFEYFANGVRMIDSSQNSFIESFNVELSIIISQFIVENCLNDNDILSAYTSITLIVVKANRQNISVKVLNQILNEIEQVSEYKNLTEELSAIYIHAQNDFLYNSEQIKFYLKEKGLGSLMEKEIQEISQKIFSSNDSDFVGFYKILACLALHLDVKPRDQLYILKLLQLFLKNEQ